MNTQDTKDRVFAAHKLLFEETTTREKFESIRTLIKGINPRVDEKLDSCANALSDFEKWQKGEIIDLTIEHVPESTEEEKERKKRLLFFVRCYKDLRSEVERVKTEFKQHSESQKVDSASRILAGAKGPFGIVTLIAIVIVGAFALFNTSKNEPARVESSVKGETSEMTSPLKTKVQVIEFNGKKIPLSEVAVRQGPDCDSPHYHAANHIQVKALDGSTIADPGACAFGRVKDVKVLEIEQ